MEAPGAREPNLGFVDHTIIMHDSNPTKFMVRSGHLQVEATAMDACVSNHDYVIYVLTTHTCDDHDDDHHGA